MAGAYGRAGSEHKEGTGGLAVVLGQHLLRVYLIWGFVSIEAVSS